MTRLPALSSARTMLLSTLAVAVAATGIVAVAPPAHADDSSTLTVVGTSDVYDSNLIQSVIKPGFEAAYPGITLNYVSKGTGAAIAYAEAGSASALVVHAASLENQYVANGYSLENYGRAIFYGDYILAGHTSDPAGVGTADPNDIVSAFETIAAKGASSTAATFVSRGGTPGTTVQEHAIWALTDGQKSSDQAVPADGLVLCQVSAANGGGYSPSTTTGACPSSISYPSWYVATGATQGPNVQTADACNGASVNSRDGDSCYVFTDRGTFQYLQSTNPPGISNLEIVTRNNTADARGGRDLLVNSFHAYGVNPDKFAGNPNVAINSAGAKDFLTYVTSPAAQTAIGAYLADNTYGAPFLPDARPNISTSTLPAAVAGGKAITLTGSVTNVVPGTPAIVNDKVALHRIPTAAPSKATVVATTRTDSNGRFSFTYTPTATARYQVTTGYVEPVENSTLNPPFSDELLSNSTPALGPVAVRGVPFLAKLSRGKGQITGRMTFTPQDSFRTGSLQLYAGPYPAARPKLSFVKSVPIRVGTSSMNFRFALRKGKHYVQFRYVNSGVVVTGSTVVHTIVVS